MEVLFNIANPVLVLSAIGSTILFALVYYAHQTFSNSRSRSDVKKRLTPEGQKAALLKNKPGEDPGNNKQQKLTKKVAKRANDFYANSDPTSIRKMQMKLMQAGYMNPGAVGYFLATRFAMAVLCGAFGVFLIITAYVDQAVANKICIVLLGFAFGYYLPNFVLSQKSKEVEMSNRQGFPDVLDLMVVSAEAGLTMEASIERISHEIQKTYPNLSVQLNMAALEIRAGRPIDQALRSFGERLNLEEVQGFATMIQQSKELGTSVSDALRVYSDEMRHKRMMKAEEKAYALPAKMSVPVTLFILPIVIGVAVIPTVVRFTMID